MNRDSHRFQNCRDKKRLAHHRLRNVQLVFPGVTVSLYRIYSPYLFREWKFLFSWEITKGGGGWITMDSRSWNKVPVEQFFLSPPLYFDLYKRYGRRKISATIRKARGKTISNTNGKSCTARVEGFTVLIFLTNTLPKNVFVKNLKI
jgi:hypothetical protein